jgi:hypothetical protein
MFKVTTKKPLTGLIILAFGIFSGIFAIGSAFAGTSNADIDGTTSTTTIEVDGVANVGVIHFDYTAATKAYLVVETDADSNITDMEMRGWAPTENIGWISFYCKDGKNLDIDCGPFDYSIKFDANGQPLVDSYAWNDVTGWISFTGLNHDPAIDFDGYDVNINLLAKRFEDFAWSQSMGWIDFTGPTVDITLPAVSPGSCDATVGACIKITDGTGDPGDILTEGSVLPLNEDGIRVADGDDKFNIHIFLKDSDLNPITKAQLQDNDYDVKMLFNWTDTIKADQTTSGSSTIQDELYTLSYLHKPFIAQGVNGAVLHKPVLLSTYEGAPQIAGFGALPGMYQDDIDDSKENLLDFDEVEPGHFVFEIKSAAPTTDQNVSYMLASDGETETATSVRNQDFSMIDPNPLGGTTLEDNDLSLSTIKWIVVKDPGDPTEETTSHEYYVEASNGVPVPLRFKPALSVKTLKPEYSPWNTLWAYRSIPTNLTVLGEDVHEGTGISAFHPIEAEFELFNEGSAFEVEYTEITKDDLDTEGGKESHSGIDNSIKKVFSNLLTTPWTPQIEANIPDNATELPSDYTTGATLFTTIKYTFIDFENEMKDRKIKYYSNRLPRLGNESIANPVAVISGTIYSQMTKNLQEGVTVTATGDPSTNIARDTIYENTQKVLRDQTLPPHMGSFTLTTLNNPGCDTHHRCVLIELEDENIIYADVDTLTLSAIDTLTWAKNTTIINNGNIFIDSNLCHTADCDNIDKKLAIIALRDTGEKIGEGGHIYIAPDVTNIQAFIAAWGSIFSYDGASKDVDEDNGEFDWGATYIPGVLDHQLVLEGGVLSMNTVGGTDLDNFYLTGDNRVLDKGGADDLINRTKAQLYDFNYFRYFRLTVSGTMDISCMKDLTSEDMAAIAAGDTVTNGGKTCDGLDPTQAYDPVTKKGDLVVEDNTKMAKGIEWQPVEGQPEMAVTEYSNPFYIKYVPPESYIFSQEKTLTF